MRPIDADALIVEQCGQCDGACEMFDGEKCLACKADCHCDLREAIDNAPTLDYEPVRHGYWKHETPTKDDGQKPFVCSECGLRHPRYGDTDKAYFACCPWCGVRMDAKEVT